MPRQSVVTWVSVVVILACGLFLLLHHSPPPVQQVATNSSRAPKQPFMREHAIPASRLQTQPPPDQQLQQSQQHTGKPPKRSSQPSPPGHLKVINELLAARGSDPTKEALWSNLVQRQCPFNLSRIVQLQLAPFTSEGITQAMLDNLYCVRKQVVRVSLQNGRLRQQNWQLTMDHTRLKSVFWLIKLAAARAQQLGRPLPPIEFIANPTDKTSFFAKGYSTRPVSHMPLFCNAKCAGDDSISFPFMLFSQFGSPDGDMSLGLYQAKHQELVAIGASKPWREKIPKMFFSAANVRGHRQKLLETKDANMDLVPANVPLSRYGQYQYLVYTYGHSGWSRRLRELAMFDTAVLLENSTCHEFFAHVFEPYVHYIPVAEDLSDLPAKLTRAVQHADTSEAMAQRWRRMGQTILSLECILAYVDMVLRAYAKLQRFNPLPREDWAEYWFGAKVDYFMDAVPPDVGLCRPYF